LRHDFLSFEKIKIKFKLRRLQTTGNRLVVKGTSFGEFSFLERAVTFLLSKSLPNVDAASQTVGGM
jgi:hypothetical protein